MSKLISPNDLQAEACKAYGFDAPTTREQWTLCVNYWAANIASGLEVSACRVLGLLFDCPLSAQEIERIADFQHSKKGTRHD